MIHPKRLRTEQELPSEDGFEVHLLYFGTTIIHTFVHVDQVYKNAPSITFQDARNAINARKMDQLSKHIHDDLQNVFHLLKRTPPTGLIFKHLEELDNDDNDVYIFQYSSPPVKCTTHQFSSIDLTELISQNILQVIENEVPIPSTPADHDDHYALEMYRRSSIMVKAYYTELLASAPPAQQATIQELITVNDTLNHPEHSTDYVERTWTVRLYEAMRCHTPYLNPKLTLDDAAGGAFANNVLAPWSGLKKIMADCVPFRGSPDITIENKILRIAADDGDSDVSGSDVSTSPMEIAVRCKLSKATSLQFCLEKLGELSAAMLTKAFCKALRGLKTSITIPEVHVHGLLLNRIESEAIQCEMLVTPILITDSRRIDTKKTQLQAQQQFLSSSGDLCQALHYFRHP